MIREIRSIMRKILPILLVPILILVLVPGALAQDVNPQPPSQDEVNAIAKEMYCPVCENTPLDVCPTQACAEWRDLIRDKLAEGWNEQQIKDYFVLQYGDRVLAAPPARGLNLLIYIIPPLAILAGGIVLFRVFRNWGKEERTQPRTQPEPDQPEDSGNGTEDLYVKQFEKEYLDSVKE
jgi:cytochrome c-type biogenesis protein CcmH